MNINYLKRHLDLKREGGLREFGVIIMKPDCPVDEVDLLMQFALASNLELISSLESSFTQQDVVALYPETFSYDDNDLKFDIEWKLETIKYLTSGKCLCYLFEGEDAINKLVAYKYQIRSRHGKLTRPDDVLSKEDFNSKVVRNLVHTADADEIQNILWLIFA